MRENYGPYVKCTDENGKTTGRNRIVPEPSFISTEPACQSANITNKQQCLTSWVPRKNQRSDVSNPYGCDWAVSDMGGSCVDSSGMSNCSYLNVGKSCEELKDKETCENIYNETKCLWNNGTCSQDIEWARNNASCSQNNWGCGTASPPHINLCGYRCIKGRGPFPNSTELCNPDAPNSDEYVFCQPPYNHCTGDPNFPQSLKCCDGKGDCIY